jgi:hypothetical protein
MEKIDYELLNRQLDFMIFDDYPIFESDILFEERLCNIILDNTMSFNIAFHENLYKTKKKIQYPKVLDMSFNFLNNFNSNYSEILKKISEDGIIHTTDAIDIYQKSFLDFSDNEDNIEIALLHNIEDVFSVNHEFMHYTNCRSEIANETTSYYTESFSNLIEFLLTDYIVKYEPSYKKDASKMRRNIFIALYQTNICTKIMLELMKKKINGKFINSYEMVDIINNIMNSCQDLALINVSLKKIYDEILDDAEDAYILSIRNTVALIFSCYMYDLVKIENKKQKIIELNDNLNRFDLKQVLLYLDLTFKEEFDLSEESYKKLEKSYKNNLKRLW